MAKALVPPRRPPLDPDEQHISKYLELPVLDPPLRQSAVGDYVKCPRYAFYRYWLGIVPKGRKKSIDIGIMLHLIMRWLHEGHNWDGSMQLLSSWVQKERNEIMRQGHEDAQLQAADRACEDLERDSSLAGVMAYLYNERYPIDRGRYEIKAVEQKIRVPVPGLGGEEVTLTIDLLLWSKIDKGYFIYDYKTSSIPLDRWKDAIKFKFQPRIYRLGVSLALQAGLLPGCEPGPVLGFVHGVIYRPRIQRKPWQSWEDFLHELIDYYDCKDDTLGSKDADGNPEVFKSGPRKGLPKPRWEHADNGRPWGEGPPMERYLSRFTGELLSREVRDTLSMFVRAKALEHKLGNFPRLGALHGQCNNHYGGCCTYLPFCSKHPSEFAEVLKRGYKVEIPELVEPSTAGEPA